MRALLTIFLLLVTTAVFAGDHAVSSAAPLEGTVLEVDNVNSYTYLRLDTKNGETWAAVTQAPVRVGTKVVIENPMVMHDFASPSLKKTFKKIVFGTLAGAPAASDNGVAVAHARLAATAEAADIHVAPARGANAHTVGEIAAKSAELKGQQVRVRGKVVKYNPSIMGRNWVHLRDGTGSAGDGSNDLLVTTKDQATVGDVVTAQGVVHTDKDFGAGYAYKVLIEEATLER